MIEVIKSINKIYCTNCDKHEQEQLYDIDITNVFKNVVSISGLCDKCLLELSDKINAVVGEKGRG